ncbi:MAG: DEAD/DEAH box helicase family protein [Bacilli bacterium]
MKDFSNIQFNGKFRNYQQDVLNNILEHIVDKKVHIVAAPGSGKTILGLEIIRHIGKPCLILSPSITIRQQWGIRFKENFLGKGEDISSYFSTSLLNLSLINSITYQGLYCAINQIEEINENNDEEDDENEEINDYSSFDLIKAIKDSGIKTICLDEAHHLRSEWQKALEKFLHLLGEEITIISLTGTPPYDSTPGEWKRYISLCGEIDDEIYIPQLVAQNNLCPHQDFIYFSYPNDKEIKLLKDNKYKILSAIDYICHQDYFKQIMDTINLFYKKDEFSTLEHFKEIGAVLALGYHFGYTVDENLVKLINYNDRVLHLSFEECKLAFQFIISSPSFFFENSQEVYDELKKRNLIEKKKVNFSYSDKISNALMLSSQKLHSILEITQHEIDTLQDDLRLVILTDYIKKEALSNLGKENKKLPISTVSIFDILSKNIDRSIAILSGSLIVIEERIIPYIKEEATKRNINVTFKNIKTNPKYVEVTFSSKNKEKVSLMTSLFEKGLIQILIGTKALLGEGWDSPCINALILASFVGSFMLSNQMRGRAIRVDNKHKDKCSTIYHLATVEPIYQFEEENINKLYYEIFDPENNLISEDFENISKRFDCFLAPAYTMDEIRDGIERIDIIKGPFTKEGIEKINQETLQISASRSSIKQQWVRCLPDVDKMKIVEECEITDFVHPYADIIINILSLIMMILTLVSFTLLYVHYKWFSYPLGILVYVITITISIYGFSRIFSSILKFITAENTVRNLSRILLRSLKKAGIIKTKEAKVQTRSYDKQKRITCTIINGTIYEKNIFTKALVELLSEIDNPRYLLIKKYGKILNFFTSFSCPSILASNRTNAKILQKQLCRNRGRYELIYTRIPGGNKYIFKARKYSYINKNTKKIKHIKRVIMIDEG